MGALVIVVLPVLALDVWLLLTTGRQQLRRWKEQRAWSYIALAAVLALALGLWFAFGVNYKWDEHTRSKGLPIPWATASLQDDHWSDFTPTPIWVLEITGIATNFLSGFAAVVMPFKIAEYFKTVKAELNK